MIKVILVDDHKIVRTGLRRILEGSKEIEVIGEAENGQDAIEKVRKQKPDVLVLDISMPDIDGLEVIEQIHSYHKKLPILILTMHEENQYAVRAIHEGAMGYLTKRSAPEQLIAAIKKVYAGKRYITEEAADLLAMRVMEGVDDKSLIETLSKRELQILKSMASGSSYQEIADNYHISIKTVHTYKARIFQKLDIQNVAQLTKLAIQYGIIKV